MFLNTAEDEQRKRQKHPHPGLYVCVYWFMYSVSTLSRPDLPQQPWKHAYVLFPMIIKSDDEPSLHYERRTKTLSAVM